MVLFNGVRRGFRPGILFVLFACLLLGSGACRQAEKSSPTVKTPQASVPVREPVRQPLVGGPYPALLMTQAQFEIVTDASGKTRPVPGPAKLVIVRRAKEGWEQVIVEDPDSNVYHKAVAIDLSGVGAASDILTIGANRALLKQWNFTDGNWRQKTLLDRTYGGKHNRFRDLEIGDVNGDGKAEIVIATHDQGVIEVVSPAGDKTTSVELNRSADTFIHEIEIGDVDGDGTPEFFATPSMPNKASMVSQPGQVIMYRYDGGQYRKTVIDELAHSHAKEILAVDLDADGVATLFSVIEARTEKEGQGTAIVHPVEIRRYDFDKAGKATMKVIATLNDRQCRFLTPGDMDGDGLMDLVAAAMKSGLWLIKQQKDGVFVNVVIDHDSSGYEHAALATDLDQDGRMELYVAADEQAELRRYLWSGTTFVKEVLVPIVPGSITWNLMPGRF